MKGDALVFPGQGAQAPGMGAELVRAGCSGDLLEVASAAGVDLVRLLVDGSQEELRPTGVAQPALFYTGVAIWRLLAERGLEVDFAGGHSLGEYCALVAAGAIGPVEGMGLVLRRARAMGAAPKGTMAAVLGLDAGELSQLCLEVSGAGEVCVVANENSPLQQVVSGTERGVEEVGRLARAAGARRIVPLQVGGAFHSPLMEGAAREFAAALAETEIQDPRFPVASGARGTLCSGAAEVRQSLEVQLQSPVRWTGCVQAMAGAGARRFLECGPGNTLGSLIRRIVPEAAVVQLPGPGAVEELDGPGPG